MTDASSARRPLATRNMRWAQRLAAVLARSSITPNQISVTSIAFALLGAVILCWHATPFGLVVVAACVQLRLLCNLLDGMVAIEGGKQSALGALYNEFPDRIADSLFIVAFGYAASMGWLGWLGALLAALTAYVRATGAALGLTQDFRGPLAKPHRMALMTLACLIGAIELHWHATRYALVVAAAAIALGSAATCVARTRAIAAQLRAKAAM